MLISNQKVGRTESDEENTKESQTIVSSGSAKNNNRANNNNAVAAGTAITTNNKETTINEATPTTTTATTTILQRQKVASTHSYCCCCRHRSFVAKVIFLIFILLPLFQIFKLRSSLNYGESSSTNNSNSYSDLPPQLTSQLVSKKKQGVQVVQDRDILPQGYPTQNDTSATITQLRLSRNQISTNSNSHSDLPPQLTSQLPSKKNQVVQVQDRYTPRRISHTKRYYYYFKASTSTKTHKCLYFKFR